MVKSGKFDHRWLGASIPADHWHFHRRLYERYGIVLNPGDYSGIKKDIRKGVAHLVQERGHRRLYLVNLHSTGAEVCVAISGTRLATVYLLSALERKKSPKTRPGILELPDGALVRIAFRKATRGEDR